MSQTAANDLSVRSFGFIGETNGICANQLPGSARVYIEEEMGKKEKFFNQVGIKLE
jgi:hypothetical protein